MKHKLKSFVRGIVLMGVFVGGITSAQAQTDPTEEEITVLLTIFSNFINKRLQPNGVCLYSEPDFAGERICFTSNQALLNSTWDNQASSIGVSSTYTAVLYKDNNFAGQSTSLLNDIADLSGFNNVVSSLQIALYDGDGDGIPYGVDQCENTGSGHPINSVGCSEYQLDDDNDGASNAVDICDNTSSNEQADVQGCSASQDSDGDGVPNNVDPYPHQSVTQCTA